MEEEPIYLTCPCCSSELTIDNAGELEAVVNALEVADREAGINRGLGGLRVAEASPGWQTRAYFHNDGTRLQQHQLQPPTIAGARNQALAIQSEPVVMDDKLEAALDKDLSQRNIKLNITEDNDI